jgi:hypothetical protein
MASPPKGGMAFYDRGMVIPLNDELFLCAVAG